MITPMNKIGLTLALIAAPCLAQDYDVLLRGGRVIDAKNKLNALRDVAIKDGKIAAVEADIDPAKARKTINVPGLYVTPGLIDIHTHVYAGTGEKGSYAGDLSIYPDTQTFRSGVTTVADAGCSGWRNYADFEDRVISRSRTRVLVFLNIVGNGMRGGKFENDLADMDAELTAKMALAHKDRIIGIKTAHYAGPEWIPVERAIQAGTKANIPVMVDFGSNHPESRPLSQLLMEKMRPGDIYTHAYSGLRGELTADGQPGPGMLEGRKRGVIYDVGHGGGSFLLRVAIPLMRIGFWPDSISTDLHVSSANGAMKDILNVASKFLAMGMPLPEVIAACTWNPAREVKREELGNLSVGAPADIAVLRVEQGNFGFSDHYGARLNAKQRLTDELTLRDGKVVWDLNALSREDWNKLPAQYGPQGDTKWDGTISSAARKAATPSQTKPVKP